jgi:hypothetical protein
MLICAHAPTTEPLDAPLDVSRGDAPPRPLVATIVDERVDVGLEKCKLKFRAREPTSMPIVAPPVGKLNSLQRVRFLPRSVAAPTGRNPRTIGHSHAQ